MKKILTILTIGWLLVVNVSCSYLSPAGCVITIVDTAEFDLFETSSAKELTQLHRDLFVQSNRMS